MNPHWLDSTQLNSTITWAKANLNGKHKEFYVFYVTASLDIIITNNNLFVLPLERSPFFDGFIEQFMKTNIHKIVQICCTMYTAKSKASFSLISMELIELRSLLNLVLVIIWFKSWTLTHVSVSFRLHCSLSLCLSLFLCN